MNYPLSSSFLFEHTMELGDEICGGKCEQQQSLVELFISGLAEVEDIQ